MSTTGNPTPSSRPRTLQDDLLADLRGVTAMPDAAPRVASPVPEVTERPDSTEAGALIFEVRVTPRRWSAPRMRSSIGGTGLVVTAGPLRFSLSR